MMPLERCVSCGNYTWFVCTFGEQVALKFCMGCLDSFERTAFDEPGCFPLARACDSCSFCAQKRSSVQVPIAEYIRSEEVFLCQHCLEEACRTCESALDNYRRWERVKASRLQPSGKTRDCSGCSKTVDESFLACDHKNGVLCKDCARELFRDLVDVHRRVCQFCGNVAAFGYARFGVFLCWACRSSCIRCRKNMDAMMMNICPICAYTAERGSIVDGKACQQCIQLLGILGDGQATEHDLQKRFEAYFDPSSKTQVKVIVMILRSFSEMDTTIFQRDLLFQRLVRNWLKDYSVASSDLMSDEVITRVTGKVVRLLPHFQGLS